MSLCTLVDKNDTVVGYKERGALGPGDVYRITSLWVMNPKHEVLLAQRVLAKKNDPGKWGPAVAGTIENNESYDEGIAKEAREELGITGIEFSRGPKLYIADNGHGQGYFCQTYVAQLDWPLERFQLLAEEVAAIRWVEIAELERDVIAFPDRFVTNFSGSSAIMINFLRDYTQERPRS